MPFVSGTSESHVITSLLPTNETSVGKATLLARTRLFNPKTAVLFPHPMMSDSNIDTDVHEISPAANVQPEPEEPGMPAEYTDAALNLRAPTCSRNDIGKQHEGLPRSRHFKHQPAHHFSRYIAGASGRPLPS